jgi:Sigma-54 interaction domain
MDRSSSTYAAGELQDDQTDWDRDTYVAEEDWRLARTAHVNLLLIHRNREIQNLLDLIVSDLPKPVATWRPGERLLLPPSARPGTLVLRDVGALSADDQERLAKWLEDAEGRTQVVSTTASPLLPRVQSGRFDETLYYRLNTVYVDVTA